MFDQKQIEVLCFILVDINAFQERAEHSTKKKDPNIVRSEISTKYQHELVHQKLDQKKKELVHQKINELAYVRSEKGSVP